MSVSGPGQNRAISAAAAGGIWAATWATSVGAASRTGMPFSAGRPLAAASLDDRGAFQLRDLPAGRHWLRFEGSGLVLELDRPVDLRPAD